MSNEQKIWFLVVLAVTLSFGHLVRSMYLASVWEDCLGRYVEAPQTEVIDKCAEVLR